jgi:acyl carrier protein
MSSSIAERVIKVCTETFAAAPGEITVRTNPDDLTRWDSLGQMNLWNSLEREFSITLDLDDFMDMTDVGKIVEIITRQLT